MRTIFMLMPCITIAISKMLIGMEPSGDMELVHQILKEQTRIEEEEQNYREFKRYLNYPDADSIFGLSENKKAIFWKLCWQKISHPNFQNVGDTTSKKHAFELLSLLYNDSYVSQIENNEEVKAFICEFSMAEFHKLQSKLLRCKDSSKLAIVIAQAKKFLNNSVSLYDPEACFIFSFNVIENLSASEKEFAEAVKLMHISASRDHKPAKEYLALKPNPCPLNPTLKKWGKEAGERMSTLEAINQGTQLGVSVVESIYPRLLPLCHIMNFMSEVAKNGNLMVKTGVDWYESGDNWKLLPFFTTLVNTANMVAQKCIHYKINVLDKERHGISQELENLSPEEQAAAAKKSRQEMDSCKKELEELQTQWDQSQQKFEDLHEESQTNQNAWSITQWWYKNKHEQVQSNFNDANENCAEIEGRIGTVFDKLEAAKINYAQHRENYNQQVAFHSQSHSRLQSLRQERDTWATYAVSMNALAETLALPNLFRFTIGFVPCNEDHGQKSYTEASYSVVCAFIANAYLWKIYSFHKRVTNKDSDAHICQEAHLKQNIEKFLQEPTRDHHEEDPYFWQCFEAGQL